VKRLLTDILVDNENVTKRNKAEARVFRLVFFFVRSLCSSDREDQAVWAASS